MTKNSFSIMPRVLAHFGDELIRNEIIALTELVKNAYDANAKECKVVFYFRKTRKNDKKVNYKPFRIDIIDTGDGMSEDDIKEFWLTVGTDNKKKRLEKMVSDSDDATPKELTEGGDAPTRVPLGEKGIGRFGVHKLGETVILDTQKEQLAPKRIIIDWNRLDDATTLSDFDFEINDSPTVFPEGQGTHLTILKIKGKDEDWTRAKLRKIHRALTALNIKFDRADCKLIENENVARLLKFTENSSTSDEFSVTTEAMFNSSVFRGLKSFESIKESALYECDILISGNQITDFEYNFNPWDSIRGKFSPHSINHSDLSSMERLLQRPSTNATTGKKDDGPNGLDPKNEVVDLSKSDRKSVV